MSWIQVPEGTDWYALSKAFNSHCSSPHRWYKDWLGLTYDRIAFHSRKSIVFSSSLNWNSNKHINSTTNLWQNYEFHPRESTVLSAEIPDKHIGFRVQTNYTYLLLLQTDLFNNYGNQQSLGFFFSAIEKQKLFCRTPFLFLCFIESYVFNNHWFWSMICNSLNYTTLKKTPQS